MSKNIIKLSADIICVVMLSLFIPAFSVNAAEDYTPYDVPELAMTIDIPSRVSVITSSVKKSDPLFGDGTFDYIEALTKMRDDSALLYGKSIKDDYEIEVIGYKNENRIKNLSKLSEKKIEKLFAAYGNQEDIVESKMYYSNGLTFFFSSRTLNNASGRFFYCDCYTVYNGSDITIRIISRNDNIKDSELDILKGMTDSIKFPEKRKFSFAAVQGRSVFITFIVIAVLFVLVIVYRRHDEKINTFLIHKTTAIKAAIDEKKALKEEAIESRPTNENASENDAKAETAESPLPDRKVTQESTYDTAGDEEDLSSIDLDEAIALFDDSRH